MNYLSKIQLLTPRRQDDVRQDVLASARSGSSFLSAGRCPDIGTLTRRIALHLGVRWTIGDRSSIGQWVAAEETPRVEFAQWLAAFVVFRVSGGSRMDRLQCPGGCRC